MSAITKEERQAWRGRCRPPAIHKDACEFIIRLIDALDASEQRVAALGEAWNDKHVLHVTKDGWSLRHPVRCRPNLLGCSVHQCATAQAEEVMAEGEDGFYYCDEEDGYLQCEEHMDDEPTDPLMDTLRAVLVEAAP